MPSAFDFTLKGKVYCWNVRREPDTNPNVISFTKAKLPPRAKVKNLWIEWDTNAKELPAQLGEFSSVEYLAVPGALVHTLEPALVPPKLRELAVISDESSKCSLHRDVVMPRLDYLGGFAKLAFRAEQVPNLTRIQVKQATNDLPDVLAALPLRAIGIGPLAHSKLLAKLSPTITALAIRGGTVSTLAGIERFSKLEELRVKRLTKLSDVSALATLRKLRELTLEWCPKLTKVAAVGKLPKLEAVNFWASKVPPRAWYALVDELRGVTIEWEPENIDDDDDDDDDDDE